MKYFLINVHTCFRHNAIIAHNRPQYSVHITFTCALRNQRNSCDLLYCGGREPNPQYFWGMPVFFLEIGHLQTVKSPVTLISLIWYVLQVTSFLWNSFIDKLHVGHISVKRLPMAVMGDVLQLFQLLLLETGDWASWLPCGAFWEELRCNICELEHLTAHRRPSRP